MKSLLVALMFALTTTVGCGAVSPTNPTPGPDPEPIGDIGDRDCLSDHCVCVATTACTHDCTPGGESCEVQCKSGEPCDIGCAPGEACHIQCSTASSCEVDCDASTECHVTCPATGCTVEHCSGPACNVTCGLVGLPTRTGTTATCP
jgi:hypothetical protein